MAETFIYSERWVNDTEQRLRRQRQQLVKLREKLQSVRNASDPEWAVNISYTLVRVERLEYSLRKTSDALKQFQERVEVQSRQAIAAYSDALAESRRMFS